MNTRARSTRRAKEAASNFVKRITVKRNASSPSPDMETTTLKTSRQKLSKPKDAQRKVVALSSETSTLPTRDVTSKDISLPGNKDTVERDKKYDNIHVTPVKSGKYTLDSNNKADHSKKSKTFKDIPKESGDNDSDEDSSTVTIVPRYVRSSRTGSKEGECGVAASGKESQEEVQTEKESSPQVVLSPTTKFIKGKSGEKSQIFKLSLAPGSEGQLIQAGGTVKLGGTLLKITPKSNSDVSAKKAQSSGSRRSRSKCNKGDDEEKSQSSPKSEGDQEEYSSNLETSFDEFEILDQSIEVEDESDEDVSYPSVQQDDFFSAFGLVKKSELPKDGVANKLHRLAGGKLRRVLKPNFAPGMVYKDGKIVIDDATEGSPRSRNKMMKVSAKTSSVAQKLDLEEVTPESLSRSPKPMKREWLKPPQKRSKSANETVTKSPAPAAKSTVNIKSKSGKEAKDVRLKKHNSLPKEKSLKVSKKANMGKAKNSDDIDLSLLPYRRSTRQRETKRKEWKHLLRACPDEFEKDPQWDEELQKKKQRSEIRMNKKLERLESKSCDESTDDKEEKEKSDTSEEESDKEETRQKEKVDKNEKADKKSKSASDRMKALRNIRKEEIKQINEASSSELYAEVYDEVVLKRGSFNRIRRQRDWKLAKKMLEEEQKKVQQKGTSSPSMRGAKGKGKGKVVTQGMGVYEGVQWEMVSIDETEASPEKVKRNINAVMEELVLPDGKVIGVRVEKDSGNEAQKKKKNKNVKDMEEEIKKGGKVQSSKSLKILVSPKGGDRASPVKGGEKITPVPQPARTAPMIVILGPDGKPLPPARSTYLCEKIRTTLEEVVKNPEMLRKGRVLELKVPRHKLLPAVVPRFGDDKTEDLSPNHQSFLPVVSVKTVFQKELECQVPHMCNICWVNDHMYCKNMKRLEQDLPYTGGCMHYVPCRHYMHLDEHKLINKAKFLSVRRWQARLAEKYFTENTGSGGESDASDATDQFETEELHLMEDHDGNYVAIVADNIQVEKENDKLTDGESSECPVSRAELMADEAASIGVIEKAVTNAVPDTSSSVGEFVPVTTSTGSSSTGLSVAQISSETMISSSQDSGYNSELPDSQQTNATDTSIDSIEEDNLEISMDEEKEGLVEKDTENKAVNVDPMDVPNITVTSPKQEHSLLDSPVANNVTKISIEMHAEKGSDLSLICDEALSDSDTEADIQERPPPGTEILHTQIRARATHIARSLVFNDVTIESAKSLHIKENNKDINHQQPVQIEEYGAEIIIDDLACDGVDDDDPMTAILNSDKCPNHYEFVLDDKAGYSEVEETSEFIDIRGRKHRVIKVHIAKLDSETREELMKSLANTRADHKLITRTSQGPDRAKRKRSNSEDSDESDESECKKRPTSVSGTRRGIMQKSALHQFSIRTQKATGASATNQPFSTSMPQIERSESKLTGKTSEELDKEKTVPDIVSNQKKSKDRPLSMQPIKINSTEAELPQELQDQSTSSEDGSQVLTFTTKEIRERKPELLAYIKRAGLAPVIAEKLKAEKASIERLVTDAEQQLSKLQDQLGEQKLLHNALTGEMKSVKEELQELQLMVVEDEAQAAKFRIKKAYLENRRRVLEKRRDNCCLTVKRLIQFYKGGDLPDDEDVDPTMNDGTAQEQENKDVLHDIGQFNTNSKATPSPILQKRGQDQSIAASPQTEIITKEPVPKTVNLTQQKQVIKPQIKTPLVQTSKLPDMSSSLDVQSHVVQVPIQSTLQAAGSTQQFLQIVGSDGKTQLLQIVSDSSEQQVFELVTNPGQEAVLRPMSVPSQPTAHVSADQDQVIQYITDAPQGQVIIGGEEIQEQQIVTRDDSRHEHIVHEEQIVTDGSQEQIIYSNTPHEQLIIGEPQHEQVIMTGGSQEHIVISEHPKEQIIEEVVMEEIPAEIPHQQIVVPSNVRTLKPNLQSLLRKQPLIRPKPLNSSPRRSQIPQEIVVGTRTLSATFANAPGNLSQTQTIYTVPSSSQTSVVTAGPQVPASAVVVSSARGVSQVIQTDNIIETAFAAATQGESEVEVVQDSSEPSTNVQCVRQQHVIVQQQQQVVGTQSQSAEMMNIDDIDVQPLQASQEDIMRTMESIASELLGVSSIDLAP